MEVEVQFDYKAENEDELTIKVGDIITNVAQHEDGWWEGDFNGRRGVFPDNFVKVRTADSKKTASTNSPLIVDQNPTNSGGGVTFRKEKKRRCKVLFSYKPVNEDELELEVDDVVDVLEEVEEGWWKGSVKGKTGVFPSNFVQELELTEAEKEQQEKDVCSEIKPKPVKGIGYGNIFQDGMVKLKTTAQENKSEPKGVVPPKKPPFPSSVAAAAAVTPSAPLLPPKPVKEQARVLYSYDALNEDELSLKEGDLITIVSKDIEDAGWWKGELNGRVGVFPDNFVELIVVDETRPKKPERPGKGPTLSNSKSADNEVTNDSSSSEAPTGYREKVLSLPRGLSAKRSPPDVPKKDVNDDKVDKTVDKPLPPLPGKKPNLPPPLKKTQRHSLGFALASSTTDASSAAAVPSAASPVVKKSFVIPVAETTATHDADDDKSKTCPSPDDDKLGFDGVESASEKLVHLTANRAKNPHRRPPSHVFHRDGDKVNGDVGGIENGENPWKLEMKRNQAAKRLSQAVVETTNIKDTIPEVDEKSSSRGNSLNRAEKNDKLATKPVALLSNVAKPSPQSLTTAQKASTLATEVDSKDSKVSKVVSQQPETSVPRSSQLPEHSNTSTPLEDRLTARLEQLTRQYSELSEEFASHKFATMARIGELYGELQLEKKHRLALQTELESLRREVRK